MEGYRLATDPDFRIEEGRRLSRAGEALEPGGVETRNASSSPASGPIE